MTEGGRNMYFLIVIIIGYLFGCIHGSQIVGKYKQINIKKSGMKNAGATNATLLLGFRYGLIVAFIDVFKAIISLLIITSLLNKFEVVYDLQIFYLYIKDRKSTRLNSSHVAISYADFCLKKKKILI